MSAGAPPSGGEDPPRRGLQLLVSIREVAGWSATRCRVGLEYRLQAERTGSSRDSNFSSQSVTSRGGARRDAVSGWSTAFRRRGPAQAGTPTTQSVRSRAGARHTGRTLSRYPPNGKRLKHYEYSDGESAAPAGSDRAHYCTLVVSLNFLSESGVSSSLAVCSELTAHTMPKRAIAIWLRLIA